MSNLKRDRQALIWKCTAAFALSGMLTMPTLAARPGDACGAITPAVMDKYATEIGRALKSATVDANKHGETGAYAVAATNSRDLLKRAQDQATAGAANLRSSDPSITTFAEAGQIKEHMRAILEVVPQATHWAMISAIYHKSVDAKQTVYGGITILDKGNTIFANAARCYIEPYVGN